MHGQLTPCDDRQYNPLTMSGDEGFAFMISAVAALAAWGTWYARTAAATTLGSSHHARVSLYLTPPLCAVALLIVLRYFASHDVRDSLLYIAFYLVMGAAWVGVAKGLLPALGLSVRDDAIERRNPAAAIAVVGATLGLTFCFAGGNIGDGPGWWVVVFSALLSTGSLLAAWALVQRVTRVADAVTIDRDLASGVRLSGFLVAAGLILGRAVAGDWVSLADTVGDFVRIGWPVLPLTLAESVLSGLFRPTPQRPSLPVVACGFVPALVYVAAAGIYVWGVGRW
jgi:hypothetical protein